jgi:hypothetical protein
VARPSPESIRFLHSPKVMPDLVRKLSPGGAVDRSPRRQPWVHIHRENRKAPEGRKTFAAPRHIFLTAGAGERTNCRRDVRSPSVEVDEAVPWHVVPISGHGALPPNRNHPEQYSVCDEVHSA